MTEQTKLKKYTCLFFVNESKGADGGLGFYMHYLAENFDKAVEQAKVYLHIFEKCHDVTINYIEEGWRDGEPEDDD